MPKQYLQLSNFAGGLNTKFDARDIKDDEITNVSNLHVYKPGQLFSSTASATETSRGDGSLSSGYGIHLFRSDTDLGDSPLMLELLALADTNDSSDTKIDFIENPFDTSGMGSRDNSTFLSKINLDSESGTGSGGNVVYYYADGALRSCDAGGTNVSNNKANWFGFVKRGSSAFGGDIDDWESKHNALSRPAGTNCLITETGYAPVTGDSGVGFDVDLSISTEDDDGLWEATTYELAQSFVYEGDQESLLTGYDEDVTLSTNNYFTNVYVGLKSAFDERIKGGRVYIRKKGSNDLWTLFLDIDFERGVRTDMGSDEYHGFSATSGAAYSHTSFTDATCDYNNDPTIAHDDDDGKIKVAMWVTGTGIPDGSTVSSVTSDTSFELSASTTGGAVTNGTLTFHSGLTIKGPSIDTYESINGYSPDLGYLSFGEASGLFYKTATVCNSRAFVGHVKYYKETGGGETKLMPDRLLYTPVGKYDIFPPSQYIDIGINDGEDFTALESFGTKLLAFKQNTLYIIDVTSANDLEWFLESTHNGLGVDKPSAVVKTEFGVCWARKTGIYAWSPTQGIVELSAKLDKNSAPMSGLASPVVGYYPPDSQLLVVQDCTQSSDALVYDFTTKSFTELGTYTGAAISNMQNNQDNCIWLEGNNVKKYSSAQGSTSWILETKDFDFGNPGLLKRPLKLIVSYSTSSGVTVTTNIYKDGDGSPDGLDSSTWTTAANGGVKSIDLKGIGNVASLKFKFTATGNYKINDMTIVYRTTRKSPSTGVN